MAAADPRSPAPASDATPVEASPLLTTVGLLVEAHAGVVTAAEHRLQAEGHIAGQGFEILLRLVRSPQQRLRMSELAAQTTLTASGLTRAIDRLEQAGLVAREACDADRRVSYATLTAEGDAAIRRALPPHVAHLEELFASFDAADREELERLLRRLRDALNPDAACASTPAATAPPAP